MHTSINSAEAKNCGNDLIQLSVPHKHTIERADSPTKIANARRGSGGGDRCSQLDLEPDPNHRQMVSVNSVGSAHCTECDTYLKAGSFADELDQNACADEGRTEATVRNARNAMHAMHADCKRLWRDAG